MRLVDADYIKESVKRQCDKCRKEGMRWMADSVERAIIEELDNTPTAQPQRKGKWIKVGDCSWKCNKCNEVSCCSANFCPDCGADMRGESE